MKRTMLILALIAAVVPMALAQQEKVPDAVAALEALEAAPPIAAEAADVVWNTGVYSYDDAGNIMAIGTQYFVYDPAGRLQKARVARDFAGADAVTQTYVYDVYGNLKQLAREGGAVQSITVSADTNRLAALGTGYDEAGNLTNWSVGAVAYQVTYDALGMPAKLQASNAPVRAYVYTADDERLFTYDNGSPAESHWTLRDIDGSVLRDYRLLGTAWSVWRDYYYRDGLMLASADAFSELHYSLDHLGTPRLLTNASRQQIAFQTFLPFGEEITPSPLNNGAVKKFTGHERDSDPAGIGEPLDYMHARFYNGRWGRFLSVDPTWESADLAAPQSWNRYAYVKNNPVRLTDPTGKCPTCAAPVLGPLGIALRRSAVGWFDALLGAAILAESQSQDDADQASYLPDKIGANGQRVDSKTLWPPKNRQNEDGTRVDVENPSPGERDGQVQIQRGHGDNKETYVIQRKFDENSGTWKYTLGTPNGGKPPNWVTRLLRDPAVREAIVKGMREYLKENFSMSQLIQ